MTDLRSYLSVIMITINEFNTPIVLESKLLRQRESKP